MSQPPQRHPDPDRRESDRSPSCAGRRRLLRGLGGATAGLAAATLLPATQALAALPPVPRRALAFHSLHTGERLEAVYFENGGYQDDALARINHILRDWRTGEVYPIEPALLDLLHRLHARMDTQAPFEIISAYRSPKTNARLAAASNGVAKRSLHMRGMAIDVRLPGRDLRALQRAALKLKGGGVGLYSKSGFLHLDIGRVRSWGS